MWEILSVFAPKPLFLEAGINDSLIPVDLAHRNYRKVQNTYIQVDAENSVSFTICSTPHGWQESDRYEIAKFFANVFALDAPPIEETPDLDSDTLKININENSINVAMLIKDLTGKTMPEGYSLCDIFKPQFNGKNINSDEIVENLGRGDVLRILAQMECALKDNN
jgi:hypothetical protein